MTIKKHIKTVAQSSMRLFSKAHKRANIKCILLNNPLSKHLARYSHKTTIVQKPHLITLACAVFLASCSVTDQNTITAPILLEKNGLVAIESESYFAIDNKNYTANWIPTTTSNIPTLQPDPDPAHLSDASGSAYLEILPDTRVKHADKLIKSGKNANFIGRPGHGPAVHYQVYFNTPGTYYVWLRAYSTGSEDNGVHVGINGEWPATAARVQWCKGKKRWTWSSAQRIKTNHCGTPKTITINVPSKGPHTISLAMREDGFEVDKIILSNNESFEPKGKGIKQVFYTTP